MKYMEQRGIENIQYGVFEGEGPLEIPRIRAEKFEPVEFIGFNFCKTEKKPQEIGGAILGSECAGGMAIIG